MTNSYFVYWIVLFLLYELCTISTEEYNFQLFPNPLTIDSSLQKLSYLNVTRSLSNNISIPKNIWISFKYVPAPDQMPEHLQKFISRARSTGWKINLMGKDDQSQFMSTLYANTSVLWAFNLIHSDAGVFASDIWRYAVLYLFGGFYLDDDSYIDAPLEKIILPTDSFIVAHEKNTYRDDCYVPSYNLSNTFLQNTRNRNSFIEYFGKRVLVNWAMFSAPQHEILRRLLFNVVDMIKHEYLRDSVVKVYRYDPRWKLCMCKTGPQALTATVRSMMLDYEIIHGSTHNFSCRVLRKDFEEFGGIYKVEYDRQYERYPRRQSNGSESTTKTDSGYYMHTMNKKKTPCLSAYSPVNAANLEGKAITMDNRAMYLVRDGKKLPFPNYDTFVAMKFDVHYVTRLELAEFNSIPLGAELPSLE